MNVGKISLMNVSGSGCQISDIGCWIRMVDVSCRMSDSDIGLWKSDIRYRKLDSDDRYWISDFGCRTPDIGVNGGGL